MTPSQQFKKQLHDIIQEVMEEADVWKTCLNCKRFNEERELCTLCTPPARPPARVIAFGCPSFEEADSRRRPSMTRKRRRVEPLPEQHRKRSARTGAYVCRCGRGYGSQLDGLCTDCRGGVTAWEQAQKEGKK